MSVVARKYQETVTIRLPLRIVSEANARGHWAGKARRTKAARGTVKLASAAMVATLPAPWNVMLTRVAPRQLDDDNLRGALKATRDGLADALGIDDRDPRVTWLYGQRKAAKGETWTVRGYGVEIAVWSA